MPLRCDLNTVIGIHVLRPILPVQTSSCDVNKAIGLLSRFVRRGSAAEARSGVLRRSDEQRRPHLASRSVHPFLQRSWSWPTDRHIDRHTHTHTHTQRWPDLASLGHRVRPHRHERRQRVRRGHRQIHGPSQRHLPVQRHHRRPGTTEGSVTAELTGAGCAHLQAAARRPQLSIDISCPHGVQQRTRRPPLLLLIDALQTLLAY